MQPAAGAFSNPLLSGASPVPTTVANPVDCPQSHRFCAVLLLGMFGLTPAGPGDSRSAWSVPAPAQVLGFGGVSERYLEVLEVEHFGEIRCRAQIRYALPSPSSFSHCHHHHLPAASSSSSSPSPSRART